MLIFGYYILKVRQGGEMRERQVWGKKMRKNENEWMKIEMKYFSERKIIMNYRNNSKYILQAWW